MKDRVSFETWLLALNLAVGKRLDVCLDDLPDMPFRDWYDSEITVSEALSSVLSVLRDDGYTF